MSKYVMNDAYIAINGTSLSDHCHNLVLNDVAAQIDFTSFGPSGYQEFGQGLRTADITADFYADFAGSSVHAILQPLYASGGTFGVEVRPTSAGVSATNPKATMTARLYAYSGIAGAVGAAATFQAVFHNAGTAGLVWGTA